MDKQYYLKQISEERTRQDEKWGEQNHHPLMWFSITAEEFGKMCQQYNKYTCDEQYFHLDKMQEKAINVAACCVAMLECIDRMGERGMGV